MFKEVVFTYTGSTVIWIQFPGCGCGIMCNRKHIVKFTYKYYYTLSSSLLANLPQWPRDMPHTTQVFNMEQCNGDGSALNPNSMHDDCMCYLSTRARIQCSVRLVKFVSVVSLLTPNLTAELSIVVPVSVCEHISGTTHPIFNRFLCMLPVGVAWSSSGSVYICYVFPDL